MQLPQVTYDAHGTPGVWAADAAAAYCGMGMLHARHQALQSLILATAARGELARRLLPLPALCRMDALVARLDLAAHAAAAVPQLAPRSRAWLDAYLHGFAVGLRLPGRPLWERVVTALLPPPTPASCLAALMLSGYLGLAEGQERMEAALRACVHAGGDPDTLRTMFAPHLAHWDPTLVDATAAARCVGGGPLLCADPHLKIDQLPALFFEMRLRVGRDYWLGATIPGLPGIALGRNRTLAWGATHACADNVDAAVEVVAGGRVRRTDGDVPLTRRTHVLRRRFLPAQVLHFAASDRGDLANGGADGRTLAVRWAGCEQSATALAAFMDLPSCPDVAAAKALLHGATTYSLHWVLADRGGALGYQQGGRLPRRGPRWSGLFAVDARDGPEWRGRYAGAELPHGGADADGLVVSANEARQAADGGTLATLAQPDYRRARIHARLRAHARHDVAGMQALQQDLHSSQGLALRPCLLAALPPGPVHAALAAWDGQCTAESRGAHAFALAYDAAVAGLGARLGGGWWQHARATSEIGVWWCAGIDRLLLLPASWQGPHGAALRAAVAAVAAQEPRPWGAVQTFAPDHLLLAGLPRWLRLRRGPFALPGSIATVAQGNRVPGPAGATAIGPAYRMVCDLATDVLHTSLPGGIDGAPWQPSYACWLAPYRASTYHVLAPPRADEAAAPWQ